MPPRVLIMTDSTCDVPVELVERYDIRVVPTYIQFGTDSFADDGVQITRPEFYRRLVVSEVLPTTSGPPPGQTHEIMERAVSEANHVIGITAPAKLSVIYNTFRLAAEQLGTDRVTLIDSGQLSMGMGWQVITAVEMVETGETPEAIKTALLAMQPRVDVWAGLDTMQYLRRSGRVGWATAMVGDFFQIKPIIDLHDGVVGSVTRVRTSHRVFDALVNLARHAAPLERLAIMHTQNRDRAQQLADALIDIHPKNSLVPIVEVTPVIGVHVGPNGLGLGVVRQK